MPYRYGYARFGQSTTPFANAYTLWPVQLFPVKLWPNKNPPVQNARVIPTSTNTVVTAGLAPNSGSRLIPTDVLTIVVDE